jgi:hypothetical protein
MNDTMIEAISQCENRIQSAPDSRKFRPRFDAPNLTGTGCHERRRPQPRMKLRPVRSFADNAARATEDCILDAATARKPKFEVEPTLPSQCS